VCGVKMQELNVSVSFEGLKEMRGSHVHILELFHIIWFWGEAFLYLGQLSTIFYCWRLIYNVL